MAYKVKLEIFEGPLDLLLFLIRKSELDIYNIPIAAITKQYLEYIDVLRNMDLNIAGEYIVMAATLMHIKSKMLLPQEEAEEEDVEEEDPRAELVKRLLEYQKFKEAASHLEERELKQKDVFARSPKEIKKYTDAQGEIYFEASVFDLISAFSTVLTRVSKDKFREIIKDEFTVSEKIHELLHSLTENNKIQVDSLFKKSKNKIEIIVTFLAILELIRLKEIMAIQKEPFGSISVMRNTKQIQPQVRSTYT
ncbi:MAG: segregation/condensation protein A [Candidatus Kappaea frigidicola]|nr:segregation/condensation protein A [Candidatus Kappaea frigidicola]